MKSILSFVLNISELYLNFKMAPYVSKLTQAIQIFN